MNDYLIGKKIVVIGASGLLGIKIIEALLLQGAKVIAADINLENLKKTVTNNKNIELVQLDILNQTAMKDFFANNAGLTGAINTAYPRNKSYGAHFLNVTLEDFNENLSMNLGSAFLFTQQCAIYFENHKTPFSLVNISSIYGVIAPDFSVYNNTNMTMPVEYAVIKSGLLHLNKYVVKYVSDSNFRINSVSPGGIFDDQPKAFLDAYKAKTHGAGMLDPKDMLGAILFLLSDQSKYVTGQNIIIDDGFSL